MLADKKVLPLSARNHQGAKWRLLTPCEGARYPRGPDLLCSLDSSWPLSSYNWPAQALHVVVALPALYMDCY